MQLKAVVEHFFYDQESSFKEFLKAQDFKLIL